MKIHINCVCIATKCLDVSYIPVLYICMYQNKMKIECKKCNSVDNINLWKHHCMK